VGEGVLVVIGVGGGGELNVSEPTSSCCNGGGCCDSPLAQLGERLTCFESGRFAESVMILEAHLKHVQSSLNTLKEVFSDFCQLADNFEVVDECETD
jgi:hypothetical protein